MLYAQTQAGGGLKGGGVRTSPLRCNSAVGSLYKGRELVTFTRVIWAERAIKGPPVQGHTASDLVPPSGLCLFRFLPS